MKKLRDVQRCIKEKCNGSPYFSGKNVEIDIPFDESKTKKLNFPSRQMSVKYFLMALGVMENVEEKCPAYMILKKRDEILEKSGLDVASCLHFLQDFFTQLLQNQVILVNIHEQFLWFIES